jgi:hypothetical protein
MLSTTYQPSPKLDNLTPERDNVLHLLAVAPKFSNDEKLRFLKEAVLREPELTEQRNTSVLLPW